MIGAKNSAAKAALDCYRHGANVTMVVRGAQDRTKREVLDQAGPEDGIKERRIRDFFNTVVERDHRAYPRG